MHQKQFLSLWGIFIFSVILSAGEYSFSFKSPDLPEDKNNHLKHPNTNTSSRFNDYEVDFLRLRLAAESEETIKVNTENLIWEFVGSTSEIIDLPKMIRISKPFSYRGSPMVHLDIFPWRINGGMIETLIDGEIIVNVPQYDGEIISPHPKLINYSYPNISRTVVSEPQYLILCPGFLNEAAQIIAGLHANEVQPEDQLITEIVNVENIPDYDGDSSDYAIRSYLIDRIDTDYGHRLNFLLLLGDELDIPAIEHYGYPSDDFYSTPSDSIFTGESQLYTGRIPVNNLSDALAVAEKTLEYILNPTPGFWRSKVALVADDMYRSCQINFGEDSHTENSQVLYDSLKTLLSPQPFYGVDYGLQETSGGCEHPELTADLIKAINSGVGLINYIGHGDPNNWSGEKIISKTRDLPLIKSADNKLAIWVAGTCSFGKYFMDNTFMEALLLKEDGAIALVSTTENIDYNSNFNFLKSMATEIALFVRGSNNFRLGEMVCIAKNGNHIFHTFGDPALPLPFPKLNNNLVDDYPSDIHLIDPQNVTVTHSQKESTLVVRESEKEAVFYFGSDSLVHSLPGTVFSQVVFSGGSSCFRAPIDVEACDNCSASIRLYQDEEGRNGEIQLITDIPLVSDYTSFEDIDGPEIQVQQEGRTLSEGSVIIPGDYLTIVLNDNSGINLMNSLGHEMHYWLDDTSPELIQGEQFSYTDGCSLGEVLIPTDYDLLAGLHNFHFEVWDGVNNFSSVDINLDAAVYSAERENFFLSKVYPMPSPFSKHTHFTMVLSDFPAEITITVYTLNGVKVRTLNESIEESFAAIRWDGKDEKGYRIANGAYFYHVNAHSENGKTFEKIYKVAKIE